MSVDLFTTSSDILQSPPPWSKILFSQALRDKTLILASWVIALWLLLVCWPTTIGVGTAPSQPDLLLPVLLFHLVGMLFLIPFLLIKDSHLPQRVINSFQTCAVYVLLLTEFSITQLILV